MLKILLLTHNTADNLGDLVIEATAKSLVKLSMENLGFSENDYIVDSIEPGMVNQRYFSMHMEDQIKIFENKIASSDLIIFGGAPVFNYKYEGFSERTVKILNLTKKYNKPVIFSAIGVEDFEKENPKCVSLRNALLNSNVKMITTRDNYKSLSQMVSGSDIRIAKVSDPAVFTNRVFRDYLDYSTSYSKAKIGIFIIRGRAFADNKIPVSEKLSIQLWSKLISEIQQDPSLDYEILTSGAHSDEAFLHRLQIELNFPLNKCVLNMDVPEELVRRISTYKGVITCRLHPSIISYSLGVPCVGLVWNNKVSDFYDAINYSNRCIKHNDFNAEFIVSSVKKAILDGVVKNQAYDISIYEHLFNTMKEILRSGDESRKLYTYDEVVHRLPRFVPTDYRYKMNWKISRIYRDFNNCITRQRQLADENKKLKSVNESLIQILKKNNIDVNL